MSMSEGTIVEWLLPEGGEVKAGQSLYSIETEKTVVEVEAPEGCRGWQSPPPCRGGNDPAGGGRDRRDFVSAGRKQSLFQELHDA